MDLFVEHLKALCREHPTRAKWVVVPGHGIGRTLGDRLVREGIEWGNLRFVTPLDLALRIGAPFLVERGINPSEEQLGPALMMRLLLALPDSHQYFRPLAHEPAMATALWSALRELRLAGLRARDLRAEHFESPGKHAELQALVDAYERYLVEHKLGDQASVYEEALVRADWCPVKPADCWSAVPGVPWAPLPQKLLDMLPGESRACPPVHVPSDPTSRAHFFTAGGPESEVEEVVRQVLTSGRPIDDVEIACASAGYDTLLWEKACAYHWPVTLEAGLPATLTRPGRGLLSFIEWIEDDFAAGHLRKLLQSGDVTVSSPDVSATGAARLLIKADAAWGRGTYRLSLSRLATSSRARAREDISEDERRYQLARADQADALAVWIDALLAAIPRPGADGLVDLQGMAYAAAMFVESTTARHSALDHKAVDRIVRALRELRALGEFRCSTAQALRFVRERVESLSIGADRPRPGHLHVSRLSNAGWAGRGLTFVVGLEEGRVFPAAVEDPVLLDRERAAISSSGLPSSDTRLRDVVERSIARLETMLAGGQVHLSYSCRDLRQFRATYASWVMLHAYRRVTGDPAKTYQDLRREVGDPVSVVPSRADKAPGLGRLWLHAAARSGNTAVGDVLAAFPALAQGRTAEGARDSAQFTEYDGFVPAAGQVLDPAQDAIVVSPTQLEGAAECPFRHFLRRGLGVDAIETGERDRDVWLNPLIRGSLLHELYAEFHTRGRDNSRVPEQADAVWLQTRGQEVLDATAREMPPPSGEVGERESREFLEDLAIFAAAEIDSVSTRTPVALEAPFDGHVISAGDITFRVRGRIDRIDLLQDGTFEILDYKTGSYFAPAWKGTFAGGRRLQHALYGLAAAELLRTQHKTPKVVGATYYFSSVKGRQHQKRLPAPSKADLAKILGDLRDVIAQGLFIHTPKEDDCRFCDYGNACGARAHQRAAAKLDDEVLMPYRRLANYE